jgi:DNA-binding MarR family transcriptional regulator
VVPVIPKEKDLGEQANALASLTGELAQCCMAKEVEIFRRFHLSTSEGHVLMAVASGVLTPSALAAQLGVVRSRVTPLVQGMVTRGFLQRTESREDRRMRDLKLTREGEHVVRDAMQFRLSFHTRLLGKFDREARAHLLETLAQLHTKMIELRQGLTSQTHNERT